MAAVKLPFLKKELLFEHILLPEGIKSLSTIQ
jgi:hypothetical protein